MQQEAEKAAQEKDRAVRMAAQIISIAANSSLGKAFEKLQHHMVLHGDLLVAAQFACEELMDGPRHARPAEKVNDVPDNEGISSIERQLGRGACTPTVQVLAKRSREEGSDSRSFQPKRLFDKTFNAQMQDVGVSSLQLSA